MGFGKMFVLQLPLEMMNLLLLEKFFNLRIYMHMINHQHHVVPFNLLLPFNHGRISTLASVDADRRGDFSCSSASRSSRGDITPDLTFSIANRNLYVAVDAHDIYDRFITRAIKFAHGDTVTAIESLVNSRRDKVKMVRLLLMTDRFPISERLGNLLQSLETVAQTISCVTVLVNMPPMDDAVTSVRTQGFSRGPIHRRGQNDLFQMYSHVRGERVIAIGFKQNS